MRVQPPAPRLSPREREIASLLGLGLTNKEIAVRLKISRRTADTHVQNMLNKLGASNRAQIVAAVSETLRSSEAVVVGSHRGPDKTRASALIKARVALLVAVCLGLVLVSAVVDRRINESAGVRPVQVGSLLYEAKLSGDGEGFGTRYVIGDPTASSVAFRRGVVEFAVLKPDGNTGDSVAVAPLQRYYTELELTVEPGSNVEFWLDLDSNGYITHIGDHLVDFETAAELMQLQYLVPNQGGQALGPQVRVSGMQSGRTFRLAAMADPPLYQVYLDGTRVVSLRHAPSALSLSPSFAIFGQGGSVRLTAMRIYGIRG